MSAKTPARLASGLLSRKGMAAPSAGPQMRENMVRSLDRPAIVPVGTPPLGRLSPAPVRGKLADRIASEPAAQKRVRVSLRLDEDRHARLKLAATHWDCTLQSIFIQAIDECFERHAPDLQNVTAHLRRHAQVEPGGSASKGNSRRKRSTEG